MRAGEEVLAAVSSLIDPYFGMFHCSNGAPPSSFWPCPGGHCEAGPGRGEVLGKRHAQEMSLLPHLLCRVSV